ncbi:hypothetical protein DW1_2386 [Proteiniborus sp. DW1]|uniref:TolC family protein n=1 Tax=Proteiniborus sp. DW1 TaxID=1889883 RepID=UPI00092DF6DA|nr:TolC family protein [Proteiniborus sp. DW1]SCG83950.1 hypothetical protein DW1_2386 [Proteiniborus sp. DW1]
MDNKLLKRIKNVVISFFVIIFILGFFSKSTIALFLPKVQVAPVTKSAYSKTLDIEGSVVPKEVFKVRINGDIIVDEFYVKAGQEIKRDQPVFKIDNSFGIRTSGQRLDDLKLSLDKNKQELEKLISESYESDEKNIELFEEKLKLQKEELEKLEELYENGAVAYSILEQKKMELTASELTLEIMKHEMELKKSKKDMLVAEIQRDIKKIQDEIASIENQKKFYSRLGEDGIYFSEVDGIILDINTAGNILSQDVSIVEIALVDGFDSVLFEALVTDEYYDFINSTKRIELNFEDKAMPKEVVVTSISRISENNMIRVEGEFGRSTKEPIIGQRIRGKAVRNFNLEGTIPKDAIIPVGSFDIGNQGIVYILEEKEGILGTEYFAKQVNVTLTGVGDNNVSITGLEGFTKPKVITNLSYKIKDGVKVFLWK